jgi:hypothetical protein
MKPIYNTYLQLCIQNFNLGIILCKYYYSVLIGLIPPHLSACPRTGSGFGSHDNFYIQWFEVVCFVDIGGIVDYHCLSTDGTRMISLATDEPDTIITLDLWDKFLILASAGLFLIFVLICFWEQLNQRT